MRSSGSPTGWARQVRRRRSRASSRRRRRPARLSGDKIAAALAGVLPEGAIVADESVSVGRNFFAMTRNARPHSWLQVTGGAIGCGLPLATGAATACPDRPVVCLEADGSAMYTLQALWTQAREGLNVTTVILSNRSYAILLGEMRNVGVEQPGPVGRDMMTLDRPALDWPSLARGMGVEAAATDDAEQFRQPARAGARDAGPVPDRGAALNPASTTS